MAQDPETRTSLLLDIADPGNQEAWFEFASIYQGVILNYARRYGLQDADAQDVVQMVMARVAKKIHEWDPERSRGSFRGWLATTVRNLAIDHFRAEKRRPQHWTDSLEEVAPKRMVDDRIDPAGAFDWEQRRSLFQWAAGRVQQEFHLQTWQAFWQTAVQNLPASQVARDLQMSCGAVYVARSRVLARIRQLISQSEFDSKLERS